MPLLCTEVAPLDVRTDRWLIEALSQMSSNPSVRHAAAAWLHAHTAALDLGASEPEAQARADEALRHEVGTDPPQFGRGYPEHRPHARESGGRTNG